MLKKVLFIAFVLSFFISCHNKLEVLAPYKESVAVYGLLNQDDTAQYVRVQRVFLGEGNAYQMAQVPDSTWFKPGELKVSLQRIKNGSVVSVDNPASTNMEIVLSEVYITTDTGVFNTQQLAYKTKHSLYQDSQYKLLIHSNKTGKDFSSTAVGLIGDFSNRLIYGQEGSILTQSYAPVNIVPEGGAPICKYGSPTNAGVCGLKLRFYYTEYTNGGQVNPKYIDVSTGIQYPLYSSGGYEIDLSYSGDGMLNSFVTMIGINANINHRTADSVHYILNSAGAELALYNQVSTTTTLSQDKPYYTNINGGVGIFSSRREYMIRKKITDKCVDHIAEAHISCPVLHFYGSGGGFLTCQ